MENYSYSLEEIVAFLAATDSSPLVTLDAILKEEQRQGYGRKKQLGAIFVGYQKIGLLAKAIKKESRQGGAGLWHPSQGVLFDLYLRLRKEQKADTISMANIPIGFWLLDFALGKWIPISIEQAQRAFDHATKGYMERWGLHSSPIDKSKRSSKIGRSIQETNRAFTSKGLKIKMPKDRKTLEAFSNFDAIDFEPGVSLEEFTNSGLNFRDTKPEIQGDLKYLDYLEVQNRLIGIKYRDVLCKPDAQPFWLWAREHWLDAMEWASERQSAFESITPIEIVPKSGNTILEKSIIYLLGEFGRGIRRIQAGDTIPGVPADFFKQKE